MDRKSEITKNVAIVHEQIVGHFQTITTRTAQSRTSILEEVARFHAEHDQSAADLRSKMDRIEALRKAIGTELDSQRSQLGKVRSLLDDHAMDRKRRKMEILRIGQTTSFRFESQYSEWTVATDEVAADCEDADNLMIAVHAVSFSKITKHLAKFGKLKYKVFRPIAAEPEVAETKMDDVVPSATTKQDAVTKSLAITECSTAANVEAEGPSNGPLEPQPISKGSEGQIEQIQRSDFDPEQIPPFEPSLESQSETIHSLTRSVSEKDALIESTAVDGRKLKTTFFNVYNPKSGERRGNEQRCDHIITDNDATATNKQSKIIYVGSTFRISTAQSSYVDTRKFPPMLPYFVYFGKHAIS